MEENTTKITVKQLDHIKNAARLEGKIKTHLHNWSSLPADDQKTLMPERCELTRYMRIAHECSVDEDGLTKMESFVNEIKEKVDKVHTEKSKDSKE